MKQREKGNRGFLGERHVAETNTETVLEYELKEICPVTENRSEINKYLFWVDCKVIFFFYKQGVFECGLGQKNKEMRDGQQAAATVCPLPKTTTCACSLPNKANGFAHTNTSSDVV